MHVVVLGGGLAGLAAAHELAVAGVAVTLLEREPQVGGMAASLRVGPYVLDHGPHRFYTRDPELLRHVHDVLDGDVVRRRRRSRILLRGRFFDYPLRAGNVLANLPPLLLLRALADYAWVRLLQRVRPRPDANFEQWVVKRFGRTLYELFFGVYTRKAWRMPCTEISAEWAAQRISQANLWDTIVKTLARPRDDEVRGLASEFHYPAHGGIGELARKYAEKIARAGGRVVTSACVARLELSGERIARVVARTGEGELALECDAVVSTIPLSTALRALSRAGNGVLGTPEHIAIDALRHIGIVFVYLEVQRPSVIPDHWVYLPEEHLTVHRVSEFKNFSDANAPATSTVVCCEITCRPGDARWKLPDAAAAAIAERDLVATGLLAAGEARALHVARLDHAYPVYDLSYRAHLDLLRAAARRVSNLSTTGRQGLFRYNNMDHSIAMGRKAARALLQSQCAGLATRDAAGVASAAEYFG